MGASNPYHFVTEVAKFAGCLQSHPNAQRPVSQIAKMPIPTSMADDHALTVNVGVRAIVFSGAQGSRLAPLVTPDVPKPLLPVGNRPALFYSLYALLRANVADITVVTTPASDAVVRRYVEDNFRSDSCVRKLRASEPRIVVYVAEDGADTAQVLLALVGESETDDDIVVLSGDVVGDVEVAALVRKHRAANAACTLALYDQPACGTYTVLDAQCSRLYGLYTTSDVSESELNLKPSLLRCVPQLALRTELTDAHTYVFASWVVKELLPKRPAIESLRYDLVPYLARRQFRLARAFDRSVTVATHLVKGFVTRTNTVEMLLVANAALAKGTVGAFLGLTSTNAPTEVKDKKKAKKGKADGKSKDDSSTKGVRTSYGSDSIVGSKFQDAERCSVKKSVIGNNVCLGKQVKLNGCVLADDVRIEESSNLNTTFVSRGATVMSGCKLKDCIVAPGIVVPEGTEATERAFATVHDADIDMEDDIDLGDDITFE